MRLTITIDTTDVPEEQVGELIGRVMSVMTGYEGTIIEATDSDTGAHVHGPVELTELPTWRIK